MNKETYFNKISLLFEHPDWYQHFTYIRIDEEDMYFRANATFSCIGYDWTVKEVKKNKDIEQGILIIEEYDFGKDEYIDYETQRKEIPYTIYKKGFIVSGELCLHNRQFFEYKVVFKKDPFPCRMDPPAYIDRIEKKNFVYYGRTNSDTEKRTQKALRKASEILDELDNKRRKNKTYSYKEINTKKYSYFSTLYNEKIFSEFNDA